MKSFKSGFALASTFALALAACGEDIDGTEPADTEATAEVTPTEFDPLMRDYQLSEAAQTRRDEFDLDAFQEEYRTYRDEIVAGTEAQAAGEESSASSSGGTENRDTPVSSAEAGTAGASSTGAAIPERSSMSWSYLDRNDDGQLSVAEYAIWAIPLDPAEPLPNDENAPYVSAEQANKAADSFFYYDVDGDSYLSQREFTAARRGEDIAPTV